MLDMMMDNHRYCNKITSKMGAPCFVSKPCKICYSVVVFTQGPQTPKSNNVNFT